METEAVLFTGRVLELIAVIIIAGAFFAKLSKLLHLPDVVMYIVAGIVLGPYGLDLIHFDSELVNQVVLTFGAAYILFDGGREIKLHILNKVKISVTLLATAGVVISTLITGFFASYLLHLNLIYALLLGTVIASTDPSVLVPLFKGLNIGDKLKQTIIAESAFNDAAAAILTFSLVAVASGSEFSLGGSVFELLKTAVGGILVGLVAGFLVLALVADRRHGVLREFKAEVSLAMVAGAYAAADNLGLSGFMAVFVLGIVLGNKETFGINVPEEPYRAHLYFKEVSTSIIRMMIFTLLGLHIDFAILAQYWSGALLVVILFILVARPVCVFCSVILDRKAEWNVKEVLYLMWVRETGVIPAALAGMLVTMKVPYAQLISSVTFMAIIITLVFQASSKRYLARLLGLQ